MSAAQGSPRWLSAALLVALLAVIAWVYAPVRGHGFVNYDDDVYLLENPHLARGFSLESLTWLATHAYAANYHPLTWASHMLDVELFGLEPGPHHLVSVAWHALNALLVFLLLRSAGAGPWASACASALFALHPLRVESVAWASERKDLLCAAFFLLTLLLYLRHARAPSRGRYLLVCAGLVAALLAKPMAVTLPALLLVLDFWPLGRLGRAPPGGPPSPAPTHRLGTTPGARTGHRVWPEKLPLFLLALAFAAVTVVAQRVAGATSGAEAIPLDLRVGNALVATATYLRQTLWPAELSVFYPHPAIAAEDARRALLLPALGALLLVGALTLGAWRARRGCPWLLTGWLWFLGLLVPVIGLVQVGAQGHADRYTYLPLIGIAWIAAEGGSELWRKRPALRPVLALLGGLIPLALALLARAQVAVWKDGRTLFEHALAVDERNHVAHAGLGSALFAAGEREGAETHLLRAIELHPLDASAHTALGRLYLEAGELARAEQHLESARAIHASKWLRYQLGRLRLAQGDPGRAAREFEAALRIDPSLAGAHFDLGQACFALGEKERARQAFEQARRLAPDRAGAYNGLGALALEEGRPGEAEPLFRRALELDPGYADALHNLGLALERQGRLEEARDCYRQARALQERR